MNPTPNREALVALLARNRELIEQLQRTTSTIDQLFAAQKDALRGAYQTVHERPLRRAERDALWQECNPANGRSVPSAVLIVVEDNDDDLALLKRALRKVGSDLQVWWAQDGQEALSILDFVQSSASSICIVSGVRLIGADGIDLLAQVRARTWSVPVKLAVLTGMSDRTTEVRARNLGADAFFKKPSNPADLVQIARTLQELAEA